MRWLALLAGLLLAASVSACSSAPAAEEPAEEGGGDCFAAFQALGMTYWGAYTRVQLDLREPLGTGSIPSCSDGTGPKGEPREFKVWRLAGVDPSVAVASPGTGGRRNLVWMICPDDHCDFVVPDAVQKLVPGG